MKWAVNQSITDLTVVAGADTAFYIDDLIDYTFDTVYASATSGTSFEFTGVAGDNFTYFGIAGHNIGTLGATIDVYNHDTQVVTAYAPIDDRPLMWTFSGLTGGTNDLRVVITKTNGQQVIISHVATGTWTDFSATVNGKLIEREYESGYNLVPYQIMRKHKTSNNKDGAPTSQITRTMAGKVSVSLNNVGADFARTNLVTYQRFWLENGFFIQNDDIPDSSFMAFNCTAGNVTPVQNVSKKLVNISYALKTYNGL